MPLKEAFYTHDEEGGHVENDSCPHVFELVVTTQRRRSKVEISCNCLTGGSREWRLLWGR